MFCGVMSGRHAARASSGFARNLRKKMYTEPAAYVLIHCGGRKLHIGDRVDEDFVAIKNAAGETPFIVAFTFGEYGQNNHSGATIGGLSLSFTGFSE